MSALPHGATPYYFVPAESRHPVMAAAGLFFVILGASQWLNGHYWGKNSFPAGRLWWLFGVVDGGLVPPVVVARLAANSCAARV